MTNHRAGRTVHTPRSTKALAVWLVVATAIGAILVAEAKERGKPNTWTRKEYCWDKQQSCVKNGKEECGKNFPEQPDLGKCTRAIYGTCNTAYDDCVSDPARVAVAPRVGPNAPKPQVERSPAGGGAVLAPGMSDNTDRYGSDYRSFATNSAATCQKSCRDEARCKAWTYVRPVAPAAQGVCYLKDPAPPATPNSCCISNSD